MSLSLEEEEVEEEEEKEEEENGWGKDGILFGVAFIVHGREKSLREFIFDTFVFSRW